MKEQTILLIRDNEIIARLPHTTIRPDGSLWIQHNCKPVCDANSTGMKREGENKILKLMKTGKAEQIPLDCLAKIGENKQSGLLAVDSDEYYAPARAKALAKLTPAKKERIEISKMYSKANAIANSDSEDNVRLPIMIQNEANAALKNWRKKYPTEAAKEAVSKLRSQAAEKRSLASGALLYDADGWLSSEAQQRRHDEFLSEAEKLDEEAKILSAKHS